MMRKSRALAGAALVIVVLAGLAAVFFRQALLRGPVREAAEARLAAALGQPVTIGAIGVTLFPRPAVTGSNVRVGAGTVEAPSVRLDRVLIIPRLRSIFSSTLEVEDVRLDGFEVSVLRTRDGRWHAPAMVPAPKADDGAGLSIAQVRIVEGRLRVLRETAGGDARESSSIDHIEANLVPDRAGLRLSPIRGRIGHADITGDARTTVASVQLAFEAPAIASDDVTALLALLGSGRPEFVRLDSPASASATVVIDRATARMTGKGVLHAPGVTIDPLQLRDLEAPFTIQGSRLTFDPTSFTIYRGAHRGSVSIDLDANPPRWSAASRVQHLDLGAFLDALAARDAQIDGTARVDATLSGPIGADLANTVGGRARLDVSDGVLHDFALLAAINRALRLTAGDQRDTKFARLSATLAIGHGSATTSDLSLDAGDVRVAAAGRIGFDRSLDLRGLATLSEARTAAAVASIHELARLRRNGTIDLPLAITGSLDNPAFTIDVKSAIEKGIADELLRQLGRFIKR